MANKEETYLQLAPEFGSTKFGPFLGVEIRLGSDATMNDITLPEAYGIAPEHIKILIQPDGSYILAPTQRSASVYAFRGQGRPKQITAPMAVAPGDSFALATPEGPRFFILRELPKNAGKAEMPQDSIDRARKRLTGRAILEEIKRVGLSKVFMTGVGNLAMRAWTFFKSGSFLQPRYIVMMMAIATGWIMACGAGGSAAWFQQAAAKASKDVVSAESRLQECEGRSGAIEDQTIPGLTASILGDRIGWEESLKGDDAFNQAYRLEYRKFATNGEKVKRLMYVVEGKSREFIRFKGALENSQVPANLARVLAFLAAPDNYVDGREWTIINDSTGERACGRGPAQLTYRQAKSLNFSPLQVNALVPAGIALGSDLEAKRVALLEAGGASLEFTENEVAAAEVGLQGELQCLHVTGDDARTDPRAVAGMLGTRLSGSAPRLPAEGDQYWQLARLMTLYGADSSIAYSGLNFDSNTAPSVVLDSMTPSEQQYVIGQSAALVAKSIAVYCSAALTTKEPPKHMPDLPGWADCLILDWLIKTES